MGYRSKYDPAYARQARLLCEEFGATNEQVAKLLNCSTSTLHAWRQEHEELDSAIRDGKRAFDAANVEASVLACAIGFYQMVRVWHPVREEFVWEPRYFAPNPKCQLLWLHNRSQWSLPGRVQQPAPSEQEVVGHPGYESLARQLMEERYRTRIDVPSVVTEETA